MKETRTAACKLLACALMAGVPAMRANAQADVSLCDIHQVTSWTAQGTTKAYSIGTTSVNVGTVNLNWIQNGTNHPVISQSLFRLKDGRFEQIGQSWLKHSFCALQIPSACDSGCNNIGGCLNFLGPGCQDPYSAARNGSQNLLGPKWQVNAHTGEFTWPPADGDQGASGDSTYMRLQADISDLGDPDAIYIAEGMYVAFDDASAGNQNNNASYRMVTTGSAPSYSMGFVGGQGTQFQRPAITAWKSHGNGVNQPDFDVFSANIQVPNDGLFIEAHKASDNGDGTWHYEYAVYNMNSHRSGASLTIPVGDNVTVSNIGFHDVDYHSGDGPGAVNYDGTDWAVSVGANSVTWSTQTEAENAMANALRWATLYNFRFDADAPPEIVTATLGLYRDGDPTSVDYMTQGPSSIVAACPQDCGDDNGQIDIGDFLAVVGTWGQTGVPCDFVNPGDGVGIEEFLEVLGFWGPCP
jgi:hypothetical protein